MHVNHRENRCFTVTKRGTKYSEILKLWPFTYLHCEINSILIYCIPLQVTRSKVLFWYYAICMVDLAIFIIIDWKYIWSFLDYFVENLQLVLDTVDIERIAIIMWSYIKDDQKISILVLSDSICMVSELTCLELWISFLYNITKYA